MAATLRGGLVSFCALCLLVTAANVVAAQEKPVEDGVVKTVISVHLLTNDVGEVGGEFRADVDRASKQVKDAHNIDAAQATLAPVLAACEKLRATPGKRVVSVATREELDEYLESVGDGLPLLWLDSACADAIYWMAFIEVERHRTDEALVLLESVSLLAPYRPDPPSEKGYILNMRKNWQGAAEAYRQALVRAQAHPSAKFGQGVALRGLGYALVELRDWPGAREAYEKSLLAEPNNTVALDELGFIKRNEASVTP